MKKILVIVCGLLIIYSCKKETCSCMLPTILGFDSGCIVRTFPIIRNPITNDSIRSSVYNLLQLNGIDTNIYKLTYYYHDSTTTLYPFYKKYDSKYTNLEVYYKGYSVFSDYLSLYFFNNTLDSTTKNAIATTKFIAVNPASSLSLGQLRKLFLDNHTNKQGFTQNFKDSCFKAELGYYRKNLSDTIYKAWLIAPRYNGYPATICLDSSGEIVP